MYDLIPIEILLLLCGLCGLFSSIFGVISLARRNPSYWAFMAILTVFGATIVVSIAALVAGLQLLGI